MLVHRKSKHNEPSWKDTYERSQVPFISKGHMTLKMPLTVFHENRERLVQELRKVKPYAIVIIQAASPASCLAKKHYVQDSKFFWSFGYQKSAAIGAIDVFRDKSYLILENLGTDGLEWCGKRAMRREIKKRYLVNGVWYLDELECFLNHANKFTECNEILILDYQKLELPTCIFSYKVNSKILCQAMHYLMSYKTEKEMKVLRYIAKHLERALIHIMHRFRPGMTNKQLEAWFTFFMMYNSGFDQLTFCIFSGDDPMDRDLYRRRSYFSKRERAFEEGELCVIEAGASYFGHKLSLGIVLSVSEKFNRVQKKAYDAMLGIRINIFRKVKAGVPVDYLRATAEKFLIKFLMDSSLIYGTVEGAFKDGVGKLLIPQCLVRSMDDGREDVTELELGKTYLVQPGCYFTKRWLDEAYKDHVLKFYLKPELREYEDIVVQVSDPIIITTDRFKFLSDIPRSCCTINDMRLEDQSKKSESTVAFEKENLKVRPSLFNIS